MVLVCAQELLNILSTFFVMLIFLIYLLLGRSSPGFEMQSPKDVFGLSYYVTRQVRRYIVVKTVVSAITAVLVGITYSLLGACSQPSAVTRTVCSHRGVLLPADTPLPAVFGLLTFCLKFIPNVGSWIALLLPVPLLLLDETITVSRFLLTILVPAGIHILMGDLVETQLMGHALNMHPVFTLLTLMFW